MALKFVKFQFVAALVCERILEETEGVLSAIRIVDVFYVPEGELPPGLILQFWVLVSLKTAPPPKAQEEFQVGLTLIYPSGEREKIPTALQPLKMVRKFADDPSIPAGLTVKIQMNIEPKHIGTHYIEIDVDGEFVTKVPFTIRRQAKGQTQ